MADTKPFITLQQALTSSQTQSNERYSKFINAPLQTLLSLVGADRDYVQASGAELIDNHGEVYTDFLGAYGALNLGHNHEELIEAMSLVEQRPNLLQSAVNPLASALAETLANISPGSLHKSFFCNSGAEAVEAALKLARASSGRSDILSTRGSFHGKTLGALSITGRESYRQPFEPLIPGCHRVDYGDITQLREALESNSYAAFFIEPIQGEGGIIVPPAGYLKTAQQLCHEYGALLVLDEVQTGLGRTGYLFAAEYDNLQPDMLLLAKSLGGGIMPIGACLATDEVWNAAYGDHERCLLHTSTFGGNTRACAAGLKTIEILIRDRLSERARTFGDELIVELQKLADDYPLIEQVRGRGLMIGIQLHQPARPDSLPARYFAATLCGLLLQRHHIITAFTLNNPNVIRIEPPLIASREQLFRVVEAMQELCEKYDHLLPAILEMGKNYVMRHVGRVFSAD